MAGFVTANRWATGVETHKTSEGRILCTGIGCVGCFPDVFLKEAEELGVCEVDLSSGILGLRPFLDEESSRENSKKGKHLSRRRKKRKTKSKKNTNVNLKESQSFKQDLEESEIDEDKSGPLPSEVFKICSTGTQTETSSLGIDIKIKLSENFKGRSKQYQLPFQEGNNSDTEVPLSENHRQVGANCGIVEVDDNVNRTHRNAQGLFNYPFFSRFDKIHDELYVVSKKDIALNSSDDHFSYEDNLMVKEKLNNGVIPTDKEQELAPYGEDAVCFFFALEYYNSHRILPDFRVMEIVEALSELVDVKDIKCVQRISRRWHIVIKTRKYIQMLRHSGIKLRGRVYQLVDDTDAYFDVVQ